MIVYGGFDQAQLDAQYDNAGREPRLPQIIQDWRERSARSRSRAPSRRFAYGDHPRETLTVFPAESPAAPIWVFFHGGYWLRMEGDSFHFLADAFLAGGATCVFVTYRLAPEATLDEIVACARRAVAWIRAHGADVRGDLDRLFLAGHSAGAQLAAMLLTTRWAASDGGALAGPVAGLLSISGLFDLRPVQRSFLNAQLSLSEDDARRNSAALCSAAGTAPVLLAVGELESSEYRAQSDALEAAWSGAGVPITRLTVPGRDHFSVLEDLASANGVLHRAALRQMGLGEQGWGLSRSSTPGPAVSAPAGRPLLGDDLDQHPVPDRE